MTGLILIFILIALFMISTHRLMDEKLLENANRYNKYKIYSYQGYRDVFTRYFVKRVVCYAWWLIPIYVTLNEKESGCSMIDEKYNIRFFDSIEETEQTMKKLYETRETKPKIKRVK